MVQDLHSSCAEPSFSESKVKKRNARACRCCRNRKTRCDVVFRMPCTNCKFNQELCSLVERKNRRKRHTQPRSILSPGTSTTESDEQMVVPSPLSGGSDATEDLAAPLPGGYVQPSPCVSIDLGSECQDLAYTYFPDFNELSLPQYIKRFDDRIPIEEIVYLRAAGAFEIPHVTVRDELLRAYIEYVHPYSPTINLVEFLGAIVNDNTPSVISLLLFQAVMFAAIPYVGDQTLATLGYTERRTAVDALFRRVKVLYDSDCEQDSVTVIQSLILMSHHHNNVGSCKDASHWVSIAISLAATIGLGRQSAMLGLDADKRSLWRRLWWCCFTRDRLMALSARRSPRIRDEDYDLPMLEPVDLATGTMATARPEMLEICGWVYEPSTMLAQIEMFIALTTLCHCIGRVLKLHRPIMDPKADPKHAAVMEPVSTGLLSNVFEVICCDQDLEAWRRNFELCNTITTNATLLLYRAYLIGMYSTAVTVLHRPQIITSAPIPIRMPKLTGLSQEKICAAADDVTETLKQLEGMIRYLPATTTATLLSAAFVHLFNLRHTNAAVKSSTTRKFLLCVKMLYRMREFHADADVCFVFLDAVISRCVPRRNDSSGNPQLLSNYSDMIRCEEQHQENATYTRQEPKGNDGLVLPRLLYASTSTYHAGITKTMGLEELRRSKKAKAEPLARATLKSSAQEGTGWHCAEVPALGNESQNLEAAQADFQAFWGLGAGLLST